MRSQYDQLIRPGFCAIHLLTALAGVSETAVAQWGQRFSVAGGAAVVVQDAPPHAGAHLRLAAALLPGVRTLNLLADGYVTWLAPGTEQQTFPDGTADERVQETQVGIGLSGLVALSKDHKVSPYLLIGAVYRWSDATVDLTVRDASGQIVDQAGLTVREDQADLLLGLGFAVASGSRRILLEARAYGGTTIYLPITIGMSF